MKSYPNLKESGLDWLKNIPAHWNLLKLKYVFNNLDYKRIPLSSEERGSMKHKIYDYYGASGVIDKVDNYIFDEPLILIGEDGANLYSRSTPLAFVAEGKYWVNNHAHILKPKNGNLYYWANLLESIDYTTYITGSAQPKLTQDALANIVLPVPSLEEQRTIWRYLSEKLKDIDSLIAGKKALITLLEEKRQSMITEAVTKGLNPNVTMKNLGVEWIGEIPFNYKVIKLKHLVETKITDGPHETPVLYESGVPFISAEAIKSGSVDFNYMRGYISEEDHKKFSRKCLPRYGDIFMVKSGATTGKIGIAKNHEEFSIWSPLALIRANKEKILNDFLYYYMQSDIFQRQVQLGWNYGTQQNIGMGVIENLFIICPPIDIQKEILNEVDIEFKNCDRLNEELNMQIQKLKEYRQSLIYEVVTGKIDVRDFEVKA